VTPFCKQPLQTEVTSHVSQRTLALHQPGLSRIFPQRKASSTKRNRSSLRLRLYPKKRYTSPVFRYLDFLRPDDQPGLAQAVSPEASRE